MNWSETNGACKRKGVLASPALSTRVVNVNAPSCALVAAGQNQSTTLVLIRLFNTYLLLVAWNEVRELTYQYVVFHE